MKNAVFVVPAICWFIHSWHVILMVQMTLNNGGDENQRKKTFNITMLKMYINDV